MNERKIALAILLQAVQDAQGSDSEAAAAARRWLRSDGADLADLLDIAPEQVLAWVSLLPALPYEQLVLFGV